MAFIFAHATAISGWLMLICLPLGFVCGPRYFFIFILAGLSILMTGYVILRVARFFGGELFSPARVSSTSAEDFKSLGGLSAFIYFCLRGQGIGAMGCLGAAIGAFIARFG